VLVSPFSNHSSSCTIERRCSFLVVTSGKPSLRSKRICQPNTLRVPVPRSEEHTSELQSLMRISYAVFCLKKKTNHTNKPNNHIIKTQHNTQHKKSNNTN